MTLHEKSNNLGFKPSEVSDQLGHLPSLIRVFAVRLIVTRGPYPVPSESSLDASPKSLVLSCSGSYRIFRMRNMEILLSI